MVRRPILYLSFAALCGPLACDDGGGSGSPGLGPGPDQMAPAGGAGGADGGAPPTGPTGGAGTVEPTFRTAIRRTAFGVPHITADDWGGLGYGIGYAIGEDRVCVVADQYVKIRGERAKYHGPGRGDAHIDSDFGFRHLGLHAFAAEVYAGSGDERVRQLAEGYAAGYNRYLDDTGIENLPAACAGGAWVQPIDAVDVIAYQLQFSQFSSGLPFLIPIATAEAPGRGKGDPPPDLSDPIAVRTLFEGTPDFRSLDLSSNGWGIGAERTTHGGGMLLANPHFPWSGEQAFWEVHLTIPGTVDIYGATLPGVVFAGIGTNGDVAWTHTVSPSQRFTGYTLELDPDDLTAYFVDGERRQMESETHTIEVQTGDGATREVSRTLWRTHWGPMVNIAGWSAGLATTFRDANERNIESMEMWLDMAQATDLESFRGAIYDHPAQPFLNTVFADRDGNAFYIDATNVPNLTETQARRWIDGLQTHPIPRTAWESFGIVLLDGSRSDNEWTEVEGARLPGLVPPQDAPQLVRRDFVFNANDSHWLSNPDTLLEGYSFLYGGERTTRSLRTRMNARTLVETGEGTASGADGKFDFDELRAAALSNRGYNAEMLRDGVVERCRGAGLVDIDGGRVQLDEACDVLAAWDLRLDLDSAGAVLFREFLGSFDDGALYNAGPLYAQPFDPADPVMTPGGLAPAPAAGADPVTVAIAEAQRRLEAAGIAIDATLRDTQFTAREGENLAVHGGVSREGVTNLLTWGNQGSTLVPEVPRGDVIHGATGLTADGYHMNYGTSFIMVVELGADGLRAESILTLGESADPASSHHNDGFAAFADKAWKPVLFEVSDIEVDPSMTELILDSGRL